MQAIISKDLPATNTRPHRIKATCARGSLTVSIHHLSGEAAHVEAVRLLCAKFCAEDAKQYGTPEFGPWADAKATGQLATGEYVHAFIPKATRSTRSTKGGAK